MWKNKNSLSQKIREFNFTLSLKSLFQFHVIFLTGPISQDQQLMATLVSEKTKVTHLEKEIQNKEVALQTVMKELDSFKSTLIRDRMSSESSSSMADQDEIRRILSSPESDSDLALQNERLKYDLDKSIGERR